MCKLLSSLGEGKRRSDNRGSALITVIVVVMFITILATTLLYVSGMNYQIKQTDYKNKTSFYSGETTLENIRAQFMKDASDAAVKAYQTTSEQYVALGSGVARRTKYNTAFVNELKTMWADSSHSNGNWTDWLNSFDEPNHALVPGTPGALIELDVADPDDPTTILDVHETDGYIIVQGVKLTFTDNMGYTTIITTDFWIQAPDFNWDDKHDDGAGNTIEQKPIDITDYVQYVKWTKQ